MVCLNFMIEESYLSVLYNKVRRDIFFYILIFASSKKSIHYFHTGCYLLSSLSSLAHSTFPHLQQRFYQSTQIHAFSPFIYVIIVQPIFSLSNTIYIGLWNIDFGSILHVTFLWLM